MQKKQVTYVNNGEDVVAMLSMINVTTMMIMPMVITTLMVIRNR